MRDARISAGVSASEIAAAIGVTSDAVFQWERGAHAPGLRRLAAYAIAIGATLSEVTPS